ncbi:low molecular weight phosphatase family protein [Demequina sp. NBRC 110057]|uniref:arsenate reductase/protein-tyrosine-phosphatase family protein n=1 Tax=Demequina sp. NBRC 110057 TaxID=1570346 RepID=UPI001356461A|nr:low molecular weight phosphatase family protein [Demequina sp. NBRC 110057]
MVKIVAVCTGNLCRSPVAALLLRHYLEGVASVSSAGTHALIGEPIPVTLLGLLRADGVDGDHHRARQLSLSDVEEADLVIALAAEHRRRIVREFPRVLRRTFLLDEIARAARANAELDGASLETRLATIPLALEAFRPRLAGAPVLDIPDPYGGSRDAYRHAYDAIAERARAISAWVAD